MSATTIQRLPLGTRGVIDAATASSMVVYDVRLVNSVTVQISKPGLTYPSALVVEIKRSTDGVNFISFGTPVTISSDYDATDVIDVSGSAYIAVVVSTVGAGTSPVEINVDAHGIKA